MRAPLPPRTPITGPAAPRDACRAVRVRGGCAARLACVPGVTPRACRQRTPAPSLRALKNTAHRLFKLALRRPFHERRDAAACSCPPFPRRTTTALHTLARPTPASRPRPTTRSRLGSRRSTAMPGKPPRQFAPSRAEKRGAAAPRARARGHVLTHHAVAAPPACCRLAVRQGCRLRGRGDVRRVGPAQHAAGSDQRPDLGETQGDTSLSAFPHHQAAPAAPDHLSDSGAPACLPASQ